MNSNFIKYGLGISVVALGGCIWIEKQLQKRFRNTDYYQNAVIMLQKYEAGARILGRPLYSGKLNLGSKEECLVSAVSAKISIPIKGSNQDGILHVLASRPAVSEAEQDKWKIDQLDLELKVSNHRWTFYDGKKQVEKETTSPEDTKK